MAFLKTSIEIGSGLSDYEADIEVQYTYRRGYAQTMVDPAEPASCEIVGIWIIDNDGVKHNAPWLHTLLESDEEILSLCMLDEEERSEYAADCKADADRERIMLERD